MKNHDLFKKVIIRKFNNCIEDKMEENIKNLEANILKKS